MYWQPVKEYPNHQYVTGRQHKPGTFMSDSTYAEALDALVICCADAAILHQGLWLIAKRAWQPQPDWWVIGGRMRKGELIEQALRRNLRRELHLDIPEDRLRSIIGYYNLIWDTRAQEPTTNGCQMFSITTAVQLTDEEKARIQLNEEYADSQWAEPLHIIEHADQFHPYLVQVARDIIGYKTAKAQNI
ncbi:MAG TPA: NUDIX domain-containing protein [Ktedonosporobacter sp.]|jgi:ADP-ribose pyrophosphatase YjhB (NUDIX family)|nr:NUDIX domain-containing protein [Ktedonosporobacter sp.]